MSEKEIAKKLEVRQLVPADLFALQAVSGWLMLGNPLEARNELCNIPAERAAHPSVSLAMWEIHAHQKEWEHAADIASRVVEMAPDWPDGYIKRAFALHELKRTEEAWSCLFTASSRFKSEWVIPYNLACYACQLGRESVAIKWFERALKIGDQKGLKAMAMADPDLQPLRARISKLPQQPRKRRKSRETL